MTRERQSHPGSGTSVPGRETADIKAKEDSAVGTDGTRASEKPEQKDHSLPVELPTVMCGLLGTRISPRGVCTVLFDGLSCRERDLCHYQGPQRQYPAPRGVRGSATAVKGRPS